jgi:RecB family endonuclease NucS
MAAIDPAHVRLFGGSQPDRRPTVLAHLEATGAAWAPRPPGIDADVYQETSRLRENIGTMRLVIATCSAQYEGRLSVHLPMATRLLVLKADGSLLVHSDGGALKPLVWMVAPNVLREESDTWIVTNRKGESLTILIEETLLDTTHDLGDDPGLQKDGAEARLQELLALDCEAIGAGLRLVRREHPTDIGPVDLLCRDADGRAVAVEVKRRGEIDGVEQLTRYLERLNRDPMLRPVRGILVAQVVKPQARVLAESRGIGWVEIDYDELRGLEPDTLRLF